MSDGDKTKFLIFIKENKVKEIKKYISNLKFNIWEIKEDNGPYEGYSASKEYNLTILKFIKLLLRRHDSSIDKIKDYINLRNNEGYTVTHFLCYTGFIEGLKLLIENGADIYIKNKHGLNVMHVAAQSNQTSVIVLLKEKYNYDINSLDYSDSTPLHWACFTLSEKSMLLLFEYGANLNAQDKDGLTPLHVAITSVAEGIEFE